MITVISTGRNAPTKQRCLDSVASQVGVKVDHIYIESPPEVTQLENFYRTIHELPSHRIVALVDGDDWLSGPESLALVKCVYRDPKVLLTFGSYMFVDGRMGHSAPYASEQYRREPWGASHLKTFRAGLFQRIRKEDLQIDGEWSKLATDLAIMFPMMEMAGPERMRFIHDVLYVYNYESSWEKSATSEDRKHEQRAVAAIRAKPVYERILAGDGFLSGGISKASGLHP